MPTNRIIDHRIVETTPVVELVTLAEAKSHLIISFSDDDTKITELITQCRKAIENFCAVSLVAKTITLWADLFTERELPWGPVTGITGVATPTGNPGSGPVQYQTLTSGWSYEGDFFISFIPGGASGFNLNTPFTGYFQWGPYASPYGQSPGNRYKITYTVGYTSSNMPEDLKLAILNEIAYRYELRGEQTEFTGVCNNARILAEPYQRKLWF